MKYTRFFDNQSQQKSYNILPCVSFIRNTPNSLFVHKPKPVPEISISVDIPITYGEDAYITVSCNTPGTITLEIDGLVVGSTNLTAGAAEFNISNLDAGSHTVEATFNGNEDYGIATVTETFIIDAGTLEVDMEISPEEPHEGDIINITVSTSDHANVTITIDNVVKADSVDVYNSSTIPITGLTEGTHDIEVSFDGGDNYDPTSLSDSITVLAAS